MESKQFQITVPWGHVAVKAYGSPKNFPVLCVHGAQDNAGSFDRLISHLPTHYYYVAVDLPGHGLSSCLPTNQLLNINNFVVALHFIIKERNWMKFHCIGHSVGGEIAVLLGLSLPNQLNRLIILDSLVPFYINENTIGSWLERCIARFFRPSLPVTKPRALTRTEALNFLRFGRVFRLNSSAAEALLERAVVPAPEVGPDAVRFNYDPRLSDYQLMPYGPEALCRLIANLQAKVILLIASETAKTVPIEVLNASYVHLQSHSAGTKVYEIEGNHNLHNNNPQTLAPIIINFLLEGEKELQSKI